MSDLDKYKAEIEQVSGTPTFCVLPWIHFATRPNGDMRLCCSANASGAGKDHEVGLVKMEHGKPANFGRETPMEAWNNDYMKSVRTTMLQGKMQNVGVPETFSISALYLSKSDIVLFLCPVTFLAPKAFSALWYFLSGLIICII